MDQIDHLLARAPAPFRSDGRPFVTLSYAQSVDGSIAARPGRPLRLSGPSSLTLTHRLRASHDAILVGIGTVLSDDPRLNVRLVSGKDPQPIVVDSRLRFPLRARLLRNKSSPPWIATSPRASLKRQAALEALRAKVFRLPSCVGELVDLSALIRRLAELGVGSIMVEGGARIITSFITARLVDQILLTIAPVLVGGVRAVGAFSHGDPPRLPRLKNVFWGRLGEDVVLRGDVHWEGT